MVIIWPIGQSDALQKEVDAKGDVCVDFIRMHRGCGCLRCMEDDILAGGGFGGIVAISSGCL